MPTRAKRTAPNSTRPLIVELDRTLIRTDWLVEAIFGFIGRHPEKAFKIPIWLLGGRAHFKQQLAVAFSIDVASLPYDDRVLAKICEAKKIGRGVYLASASDRRFVEAVARHIGLFDGWFTSDGVAYVDGVTKAATPAEAFGFGNFSYIGNGTAGTLTWRRAAKASAVESSADIKQQLGLLKEAFEHVPPRQNVGGWLTLLRPHQWAKNALVLVPLLTAHHFSPPALGLAVLAVVAFCACASSAYILNDLIDIEADRTHPLKRQRPFASGKVPFATGAVVGLASLAVAFVIAAFVSWTFAGVLGLYFAGTTVYSLFLKRLLIVDAITLAGLYTVRVIAGATAIGVPTSEWLLAFSMFIFLSLALIKRYSELALRLDADLPDPENRNYKVGDLPVIASLAAAAGYCAVIVLSLYVSSDTVRALYSRPSVLWLACPIFLYWTSRMLMLSHRRLVSEDPIIFTMKDKVTWAAAAAILALGILAA